jgi:hypothetical protein
MCLLDRDLRAEAAAVSAIASGSQHVTMRAIAHYVPIFSTRATGGESRGSPKSAQTSQSCPAISPSNGWPCRKAPLMLQCCRANVASQKVLTSMRCACSLKTTLRRWREPGRLRAGKLTPLRQPQTPYSALSGRGCFVIYGASLGLRHSVVTMDGVVAAFFASSSHCSLVSKGRGVIVSQRQSGGWFTAQT